PMLSLWIKLRFHVPTGDIGLLFALINFTAIIAMFFIPFLVPKFGELNMIIWTRAFSSVFLIAAALSPVFVLSGAMLSLRAAATMGAVPVRQSFALKTVDKTERATTSGATSLTRVGSSSPAPVIGGYMMETSLELPFIVGGIVSIFDPVLYYLLFKFRKAKIQSN
ncbi:MAG: MFS transporter, partial [Thermoplasmata archaeon]